MIVETDPTKSSNRCNNSVKKISKQPERGGNAFHGPEIKGEEATRNRLTIYDFLCKLKRYDNEIRENPSTIRNIIYWEKKKPVDGLEGCFPRFDFTCAFTLKVTFHRDFANEIRM